MPRPKPTTTEDLTGWASEASKAPRRCRICKEPGKAERLRVLIAAMRAARVKVSADKIGAKLIADCGGEPLCRNTVRLHLAGHEPEWAALVKALG